MNTDAGTTETPKTVRCAIYTRSRMMGLFDLGLGVQAQREAAESFIAERADQGWIALPDRYDDQGVSANALDRPALRRLLNDVEDGKIDCVVIHSFDRLFRSVTAMSGTLITLMLNGVLLQSVTQPAIAKRPLPRLVVEGVR